MNKRGYVGDALMWGILLVTMIVVVMLLYNLLAGMSASIDSTQPVAKQSLTDSTDSWAPAWDFSIVAGLGVMLLVSLTSAWAVGTDSSFFWISLIILILFLLALVVLNNTATLFFNDISFMTVKSQMPGTTFIIDNLFSLCLAGAGLLLLVLFAKNRSESG
jgi:hypothetical protein